MRSPEESPGATFQYRPWFSAWNSVSIATLERWQQVCFEELSIAIIRGPRMLSEKFSFISRADIGAR
jgi:hypothetical protein